MTPPCKSDPFARRTQINKTAVVLQTISSYAYDTRRLLLFAALADPVTTVVHGRKLLKIIALA